MRDLVGSARVVDASGQTIGEAQPLLYFSQSQDAAV